MKPKSKTKSQLLKEVALLRKRLKKIQALSDERMKTVLLPFKKLYSLLFNSINDEIFVYEYPGQKDSPGKFLEVNDMACKDLGYSHEELLQKSFYDILDPETIPVVKIMMKKLITQKYAIWEGMHRTKDGQKIPVEVSNHLFELKGNLTIISAVKNITSRKQSEEAQKKTEQVIRESEHRFRTLAEASFEGIALTENGMIVDLNDQLATMHGYERRELIGKSFLDIVLSDLHAYLRDTIRLNQEESYEILCLRKNGSSFPAEIRERTTQMDGKELQIFTLRDITERKQMEEVLRETADKFRFVFENAYDGISIFEETPDRIHRKLIDCNKRYAEMAGRSREELLHVGSTKNISRPLSDDDHDSNKPDSAFSGSFCWIRPDGKANVIEYTAVPIKVPGKTITIGIDRDITERKRIEEEREQLIKELQNALADVKTLSGLVPICANCKQIRDDKGFWMQVESYIQERSQARFSHGICPDCMRKLYPEFLAKENE
jgi:PAS domain S-box-containing protein